MHHGGRQGRDHHRYRHAARRSAIQKKFTAVGGKTIDYDRQIIGGTGSVYISFDGTRVGSPAGARRSRRHEEERDVQRERHGLRSSGAARPTRTRSCSRAVTTTVLNPLFKAKKVKRGPAKFVPLWDAGKAQTIFEQMLVQTSNNIQGVVAANDGIAGAVVATLKAKGLKPIPLSGSGRDSPGRPEHHLGLADTDRSTSTCPTRPTRPRRRRLPCTRGRSRVERYGARGSRVPDPRVLDHQGELHAALPRQVPEAERRVLRGLQAVLQVVG